jgi:phospholipid transport system transporter-binding protein
MLRLDGNRLALSGPITIETYRAVRDAAAPYVGKADIVIDWSAVSEVDSSAIALLLAWQRDSARLKAAVQSTEVPQSLIALADLYSLTDLIALPDPH